MFLEMEWWKLSQCITVNTADSSVVFPKVMDMTENLMSAICLFSVNSVLHGHGHEVMLMAYGGKYHIW